MNTKTNSYEKKKVSNPRNIQTLLNKRLHCTKRTAVKKAALYYAKLEMKNIHNLGIHLSQNYYY